MFYHLGIQDLPPQLIKSRPESNFDHPINPLHCTSSAYASARDFFQSLSR